MKLSIPYLSEPVECVGYARVSTAKQAEENISIAVQLEECRKYAESRGWRYLGDYVDPGVSGRSERNRPQLHAMLTEAAKTPPPFQIILVYDHSRLFRDIGLSETVRSRLRSNGVRVQSTSQNIEDDGLTGSLAITIQSAVDDHQSRITAVKVRSGMAANARAGFYAGGVVPYGYKLKLVEMRGSKAKHKLAIQPVEAKIVEMVFTLHGSGMGQTAIVTKLNNEGYLRRNGKRWFKSSITRMLTSETYVGRQMFRQTEWLTDRIKPREEWIEIPCPAIIDEATFQRTQQLLRKRDARNCPPRYTTSNVLLGGISYCGVCGSRLQLSTGTSRNKSIYRYLTCGQKINAGACPDGISISEPKLDALVTNKVVSELITPRRVQEIVSRAHERQAEARDGASVRIKALKKQLGVTKRKEENLWELGSDLGLQAANGFRQKLETLQQEAINLGRQIAAEESLIQSSVRPLTDAEATLKTTEMRRLLLNAPLEERRRFIQGVVERVVVGADDKIFVEGPESTLAEVASGMELIAAPPVHGFAPEWCRLGDSNT